MLTLTMFPKMWLTLLLTQLGQKKPKNLTTL